MRLFRGPASIRYHISLSLLLSAFNGLLLVGLVLGFLSSLPSEEETTRRAMVASALGDLSRDHRGYVAEGARFALEQDLADLERELDAFETPPTAALELLAEYRLALEDDSDLAHQALRLEELRPQLEEEIRPLAAMPRSPLFERYRGWTLGLLAWATLVALLMVGESIRLQHLLSRPLSRLATLALDVARGRRDLPIVLRTRAVEIAQMAEALESMRGSLVRLIARLDAQNVEMSTMLAALDDGVLLLDARSTILEANPRALALLRDMGARVPDQVEGLLLDGLLPGFTAPGEANEDPSGSGCPAWVHAWDSPSGRRHVRVVCASLSMARGEALASSARTGPEDPGRAFVVLLQDITRSVEIEEIKRSFLSVVTHELKTPLTVIDGYVRLLLLGKGGPLSERQRELLTKTRDQATLLGQMVQDLLDTTRLEAGHLKIELSSVDAHAAVAEVVDAFSSEAQAVGLRLEAHTREIRPLRVLADPQRLRQILSNLVRNALKFTEAGGAVGVLVEESDAFVRFVVEDEGRGIPASALPNLFQKFYQVEQGDTRKAGGAGLGLYICRQLAEAMGGRIEVSSLPGAGSRFSVFLPLAPPSGS